MDEDRGAGARFPHGSYNIAIADVAADDGGRLRRSAELLNVDTWSIPADDGALSTTVPNLRLGSTHAL